VEKSKVILFCYQIFLKTNLKSDIIKKIKGYLFYSIIVLWKVVYEAF